MPTRFAASGVLFAFYLIFRPLLQRNPIVDAQLAPLQLENSNVAAGLAQSWVQAGGLTAVFTLIFALALLAIWWQPLRQALQRKSKPSPYVALLALFSMSLLAACKPYGATQIVEIKPNETAFVVPLIGWFTLLWTVQVTAFSPC